MGISKKESVLIEESTLLSPSPFIVLAVALPLFVKQTFLIISAHSGYQ